MGTQELGGCCSSSLLIAPHRHGSLARFVSGFDRGKIHCISCHEHATCMRAIVGSYRVVVFPPKRTWPLRLV